MAQSNDHDHKVGTAMTHGLGVGRYILQYQLVPHKRVALVHLNVRDCEWLCMMPSEVGSKNGACKRPSPVDMIEVSTGLTKVFSNNRPRRRP